MTPLVLLPLALLLFGGSKASASSAKRTSKPSDNAATLQRTAVAVAKRTKAIAVAAKQALKQGKTPPKLPTTAPAVRAARALKKYLSKPGADWGIPGRPSVAVAAAQKAMGAKVDGIVGPETRMAAARAGVVLPDRPPVSSPARAIVTPAPKPAPKLPPPPEAESELLKQQKVANLLKLYLSQPKANFGTKAKPSEPVRQFQQAVGIAADGIYGPQTRAAAARVGVELPVRR